MLHLRRLQALYYARRTDALYPLIAQRRDVTRALRGER